MWVRGDRRRRLLDLLVRALPGLVDGIAGVGAVTVLRVAVASSWVGLGGSCTVHRALPAVEAQGALVHGLMLAGHGDGDLSRKTSYNPYLARQMLDLWVPMDQCSSTGLKASLPTKSLRGPERAKQEHTGFT